MSSKKHIVDYLTETRDRGGSDLHITADAPPACRINGTLEALADHDISPDEAKELVMGVISESQRARLEEDLELDFSISIKNVGRFRANAHYVRGSIEGAFRYIPTEIPELPQLGHGQSVNDLCSLRQGLILVTGVTGAGKTTTIGKLAHRFKAQGKQVMLAAGDTFRAAAVEQLQAWGERNEVPVIAQHTGANSASVLFDALQAAHSRGADILIADTAGRLQNKSHLMDELEKVVRVMQKIDPQAPHETLLVLDAGTGQNAVSQAEEFDKTVGVSGIALSKLDGTARGGVIFAIAQKLARPIRFVGMGEGVTDLQPFDARVFVDALFDSESL